VGAAAFDTQTSLLAPLAPLSLNRDKLNDLISRLVPSGGTDFKEALEIAARQLIASGRQTKHVILLTDGASIRPAAEHEGLIAALAQSGVTVTSIRIGNDKDSYALVQTIAEQTGGNFYLVTDGASLPNLMIQDAAKRSGQKLAKEKEREERGDTAGEPFHPRVRASAEALGGLRDEEMPLLRGFASVPLKSGAEEWLWTEHTGKRQPILAAWQNGLGRVAVFTADPTPEWQSWGHVRRFWSQLIRWVARPESGDELRLALRREHGRPVLGIDTYDSAEGGELSVRIADRDGSSHDLTPTALGSRHYELALPPLESIEPRVQIALKRRNATVFTRDEWLPALAASEDASVEDPEAAPNWALLSQLAEITGGAVNPPIATVLARAPADRQTSFPLAHQLAVAALALVLVDIGVRLVAAPESARWR
jgi:von Willebrand factor type A domain-containing protein